MRTPRPILFAAALLMAAACTDGAEGGPTIAGAPQPTLIAAPPPPPPPPPPPSTEADSVQGGYGSGSTGGIEYEQFEYEPETGTEYVPSTDPEAPSRGLEPTTSSDPG